MKRFRVTFEGCTTIKAENLKEATENFEEVLELMQDDHTYFEGLLFDIEEEN